MAAPILPKIPVIDLLATPGLTGIGRERELRQLKRILTRHDQPNSIICGPTGIGKTTLWQSLISEVNVAAKTLPPVPYLGLPTAVIARWLHDDQSRDDFIQHLAAGFQALPPAVVVIDDADALLRIIDAPWQLDQLFQAFAPGTGRHLLLCCESDTVAQLQEQPWRMLLSFDVLTVKELPRNTCAHIIEAAAPRLSAQYKITIERAALDSIMTAAGEVPLAIAWPQKALVLFDEVCAAAVIHNQPVVTPQTVEQVAIERLGLPNRRLSKSDARSLHALPQMLGRQVQGQEHVITPVAEVIQRGWLGLKNRERPLGSFLFLGPSGVGKTELAKTLAREVFGHEQAFIRLDMSEFGEPHTVQRLTGAPPGYVGYEAGGQLTNPVLAQPFSLILLDEIEKAHPSVFDLFLQVLDDGRLTDSHGVTVDFTHTIIIATSNLGLNHIVQATEQNIDVGTETFLKTTMFPLLLQRFRAEFLNRFERISVFKPLSPEALYDIAQLELTKIEQRFAHLNVAIRLDPAVLRHKIAELSDPRLGARPLKRYLESVCESAVAQQLLTH